MCMKIFNVSEYFNSHKGNNSGKTKHMNVGFVRRALHIVNTKWFFLEKNLSRSTFQRRASINVKIGTHSGEICKKSFSESGSLINHRKIHCSKKLVPNVHEDIQYQRIHSGKKTYECQICKKSFTNSGLLNTHKIIQFGEKPF